MSHILFIGATATREQITALAQAKLAFVSHLLSLCAQFRAKAFASIVDKDAPRSEGDFLRKDYACLQVCELRYQTRREVNGNPDFAIWSFAVIDDLRPRNEREETGGQ